MGPLAHPALDIIKRRARALGALIALAAILSAAVAACESEGTSDNTPSPFPSQTASPGPSPAPTATPDSLGQPAFQPQRAVEHVRVLAEEIGPRPGGSEAEERAAAYVRDELSSYGYDAFLQPFEIERFQDVESRLELLSPEAREIEAAALGGSADGTVEGELVHAGLGRPQEFPSGTSGKIALIERGELFFRDKVQNAAAAGAAAVIVYNNEPGPFAGQMGRAGPIPALTVAREDGLALREMLVPAPVTARLHVTTERGTATSHNVVAQPPGGGCRVMAGGHYDSVEQGPGANDNASGTAVVIEMARVLAAAGELDAACFVLFGSEEVGLLGSRHYVESLSPDERSRIDAMLNFDMLGVGTGWPFVGSSDMVEMAVQEAERLGINNGSSSTLPPNIGSDHANFIAAGIPAVMFNCFCDPRYHGPEDRFEFVQPERLHEAGLIGLGLIRRLLQSAGRPDSMAGAETAPQRAPRGLPLASASVSIRPT